MEQLLFSLRDLLLAGWDVLIALGGVLLPWTPLAAWIIFWMFGVNWTRLREVLVQGGWTGLVLIGLAMILVWGVVAPPPGGYHQFFGLTISNFVGKTVYVTALFSIMLLCGAVQLSGFCPRWMPEDADEPGTGAHPDHEAQQVHTH